VARFINMVTNSGGRSRERGDPLVPETPVLTAQSRFRGNDGMARRRNKIRRGAYDMGREGRHIAGFEQ
jgi:hypothetical protein